eukprot:scaffold136202_cov18-Prasinocladus_malaysianus.AAC.2
MNGEHRGPLSFNAFSEAGLNNVDNPVVPFPNIGDNLRCIDESRCYNVPGSTSGRLTRSIWHCYLDERRAPSYSADA